MILTRMEKLDQYEYLVPGLQKALKRIAECTSYEAGRYELEDGGFYMIQKGTTNPVEDGQFETHKKYVDVQILLAGSEMMVWESAEKLHVSMPYDETRDLMLYTGDGSRINILPEMSYIVFPEDAHKACCHEQEPSAYVKAVIKLKYKA